MERNDIEATMGWAQTARDEIGLLAIFSGLEFCMCPFHARFSDSIGKRSRFWYPMCTYLFHDVKIRLLGLFKIN